MKRIAFSAMAFLLVIVFSVSQVRTRAYGVSISDVAKYPKMTTTNQAALRKILRRERCVELAKEGLRYYDLIRWGIAGKALTNQNCGLLYPASLLRTNVVNPGLWLWASTPQIDEEGVADFSALVNNGYLQVLSKGGWNDRQYLWPIPSKEIQINKNMTQNPGY